MADFRHRKAYYKRAKRKAKAISFLSNISLTGNSNKASSSQHVDDAEEQGNVSAEETEEIDEDPRPNVSYTTARHISSSTGFAFRKKAGVSIRIATADPGPDTPVHRHGVRRSYSFGRIRRPSGDQHSPPSSPARFDRGNLIQTLSSESTRQGYQKQTLLIDPSILQSSNGSQEDTSHHVRSKSMVMERSEDGIVRDLSPAVRFLKSHKQLRRNNARVVMVSEHKAPFAIFSHLAYSRRSQLGHMRKDSEVTQTSHRVRVSSGGKQKRRESVDLSNPKSIEGVELGGEGKTVSYSHMLVPTFQRRYVVDTGTPQGMFTKNPMLLIKQIQPQREKLKEEGDLAEQLGSIPEYDPNQLDDPELIAGKHKKLFTFESYMVSIIDYAKPSELKREINQKFKERYPRIDLTLSKLRSIKKEMKKIAMEVCELEAGLLAQSYVFFEKLVLYEKVSKGNRKLLAGVCLVLAAKLNDIKGTELQNLIKEVEDTFRESRKELLAFEFPVLVALQFALHTQEHEVMPHYRRIVQQ